MILISWYRLFWILSLIISNMIVLWNNYSISSATRIHYMSHIFISKLWSVFNIVEILLLTTRHFLIWWSNWICWNLSCKYFFCLYLIQFFIWTSIYFIYINNYIKLWFLFVKTYSKWILIELPAKFTLFFGKSFLFKVLCLTSIWSCITLNMSLILITDWKLNFEIFASFI